MLKTDQDHIRDPRVANLGFLGRWMANDEDCDGLLVVKVRRAIVWTTTFRDCDASLSSVA